jgi:hypothetical protein
VTFQLLQIILLIPISNSVDHGRVLIFVVSYLVGFIVICLRHCALFFLLFHDFFPGFHLHTGVGLIFMLFFLLSLLVFDDLPVLFIIIWSAPLTQSPLCSFLFPFLVSFMEAFFVL